MFKNVNHYLTEGSVFSVGKNNDVETTSFI